MFTIHFGINTLIIPWQINLKKYLLKIPLLANANYFHDIERERIKKTVYYLLPTEFQLIDYTFDSFYKLDESDSLEI